MAGNYILQRDALIERLGGDPYIFDIMVDTYLEDVDANCAALQKALAMGATAVQREAHTVKGLLATVGDEEGRGEAYAVETMAKEGKLADIGDQVAALQSRLRHVADVLRRETGR